MVAGLIAIIAMLPSALNRTAPTPSPTGETGATTSASPEISSAPPTGSAAAVRILAVGDSYTGGSPEEEQVRGGWPTLLEERMPGLDVEVAATGDAGYVTTAGEPTLLDLAAGTDLTDVDLVILFGSRFDAPGIADRVGAAAREAFAAIGEAAPEATLLVIGPAWPGAAPPAGVRNNRDVIRAAAEATSASFVDPLSEEWLTGIPDVVGADEIHLTDAGHTVLADRIQPIVQQAIEAREATPTPVGG